MALATRPKPPVHQKKRAANHHKQNKHYLKAYWPYLPMLMIAGFGIMLNNLWSQPRVLGAQQDFSAISLLAATNAERSKNHESALVTNNQLSAAAQAKADDMVQHNYWAHTSPSGQTPWSFITASGYQYQTAGENLAYGFTNADGTVTGWMNSPEHRANILSSNYTNVGFGVAQATNYQGHGPQTIVVAEYGQPTGTPTATTFDTANTSQTTVGSVKGASTELAAQPVARVQLFTGGSAAWSLAAVSAISGGALVYFITRHSLRLHKAVVRGEHLVARYPLLDIAVVAVFTAGFLLTRSSGLIR